MIPETVGLTYSHLYPMLYNEFDQVNSWPTDNTNNNDNIFHSLLGTTSASLVAYVSLCLDNNLICSTEAQRVPSNLPKVIKVERGWLLD